MRANSINLFLGFDPGGRNAFGWSICREVGGRLQPDNRPITGLADHAGDAANQVQRRIENDDSLCDLPIRAAGIDAPLLVHRRKGNRNIDQNLRDKLVSNKFPASKVGGTVQEVNSLRGGATVQAGLLLAQLIEMPWAQDMKITESHPTAFRYLLSHVKKPEMVKTAVHLKAGLSTCTRTHKQKKEVEDCTTCEQDSHKQDATLCAVAAWAATKSSALPDWRDLYEQEYRIEADGTRSDVLIPLFQIPESIRLSYWMPMPRGTG